MEEGGKEHQCLRVTAAAGLKFIPRISLFLAVPQAEAPLNPGGGVL